MISRTQGAPGARQVPFFATLLLVLLAVVVVVVGCGQKGDGKGDGKDGGKGNGKESAAAITDTTAFGDARAVADTTARLAAWDTFLKTYPTSSFRPRAVAYYCGLLMAVDPAKASDFVATALPVEKDPATRGQLHYAAYTYAQEHAADRLPAVLQAMRDDPLIATDACNMVAWDLVERNQLLDEAIALAAIGVQKAPDDGSRGSILDTQGWAHFAKGEYLRAVELLVQAVGLDKENTELQMHLAQAYDKAGQSKEALAVYTELLIPAEDPMIRERVAALSKAAGQSPAGLFQRIDQAREANAKPAPAFTLKNYDGKELAFADTKGKVVLLNFWHPT
jgi:tetratricopeptide (TPR) repeat protein